MRLGISSYALTWSIGVPGYEPPSSPLDAAGLLRMARQHGIGIVQIADNIPLHTYEDSAVDAIRAASLELGVRLELGTRGTEPDHLLRYLALARHLNAGLVRTLITDASLEQARSHIQRVLPRLEEAGVALAIENHGLHTTRQLAALFESIGHPLVGCCLDTVNSFSALDSPETVIRDLSPYIVNLHLKDLDITRVDHQMGFMVLGTPAGSGKLDIDGLVRTLRQLDKSPNAILELWTPFTRTVEETVRLEQSWFERSIEYLKSRGDFAWEGRPA